MSDPQAVDRLQRALMAFVEEFTDDHQISVAAVVGTLHVVAYEVMRQDAETELEDFDPEMNRWRKSR
ncbi:MAG: hypothetical protein KGL35_27260 [Bradyrhizobium sp.]|nr:hypothetical protein [Bradyrhizobium sp.]